MMAILRFLAWAFGEKLTDARLNDVTIYRWMGRDFAVFDNRAHATLAATPVTDQDATKQGKN